MLNVITHDLSTVMTNPANGMTALIESLDGTPNDLSAIGYCSEADFAIGCEIDQAYFDNYVLAVQWAHDWMDYTPDPDWVDEWLTKFTNGGSK